MITAEREEAINSMNTKLKRKLKRIEKMFTDTREANIRFYHNVGRELLEARDDPEQYQDNALGKIEKAMATQKRTLRKCRQFAELYNTDELLNELVNLENENTGFRLHWGHLTYLLGLNTVKQRQDWAAKAVRNLWDPPALHAAIKARFGDRGVGGGRPHKLPPTTHMQIRQMMEVSRNWVNKRNLWNGDEDNVFANVTNEAPDELSETDLENLQATQEYLDTIIAEARQMKTQVAACIERVEEVFKLRAEQAEQEAEREAETGKAHRSIDLGDGDTNQSTGGRRGRHRAPATSK